MDKIEQMLEGCRISRMTSIPRGALISRNPTVYKWNAPWRCWLLREAAFWRMTDLLTQSYELHQQKHGLGARILLRSGFETLAALLYLNHNMRMVIDGTLNFHKFSNLTAQQAAGTKRKSDSLEAVQILKMLDKGSRRYPRLRSTFENRSESAHPNFDGMLGGYSKIDYDKHETNFSNRWMEQQGEEFPDLLKLCMSVFVYEYNDVCADLIENLENWIVENDAMLEETKDARPPN